ncbi:MAG TPA: c-type cytochrome [Gaiellaceae bacterium]|nr:c-type cytochrome [Gaiellaceae bacterium]
MRRIAVICLALAGLAGLVAGCGSEGVVSPTPETVIGTIPKAAPAPATPAFALKGDPVAGKKVFETAGCKSCHTLADAGATGTVGPNLDQVKPDYRTATARVTLGKGVMPSFKSQLTAQQIADVAAYVVKATGGTPP